MIAFGEYAKTARQQTAIWQQMNALKIRIPESSGFDRLNPLIGRKMHPEFLRRMSIGAPTTFFGHSQAFPKISQTGFLGKALSWSVGLKDNTFGLIGGELRDGAWMRKLAVPGLLVGGFLGNQAFTNLLEGGYDIESSRTTWGGTYGALMTTSIAPSMSFATYSGNTMDATGSLAFSLHNGRKG